MPTAPTLKKRAATEALADAERLLAQTNRSGVRAIELGQGSADASGFVVSEPEPEMDLSNAVTKVQEAIDVSTLLLASAPSPASVPPPEPQAQLATSKFEARVFQELLADAKQRHEASAALAEPAAEPERITTPPVRAVSIAPRRGRKWLALLMVTMIMAGAVAVLAVAALHGTLRLPPELARAVQSLLRSF